MVTRRSLEFDLTGPLVIPGTIKFVRPEIDELKANISSKDEKLKAYTNSYEVLGESDLPPLILFTGKRPLLRNHFPGVLRGRYRAVWG